MIVGHLSRALLDGSRDLRAVPGLLKRIIREEMWRRWADPVSGRPYGPFGSFAEFMQKSPSDGGLGSTEKQLRGLCVDDTEALDLLTWALRGKQGRRSDLLDNVQEVRAPTGNSQAAALRRLRKRRPDLHTRVLSKELSANAAMVMAGLRKETASVPVTDPPSAARTLRRRMKPDDLATLARLLTEET